MKKEVHYHSTKFPLDAIHEAWDRIWQGLDEEERKTVLLQLTVRLTSNEKWDHDTEAEFFADYLKDSKWAYYVKSAKYGKHQISLSFDRPCTDITIASPSRAVIEEVHQIFNKWAPKSTLPKEEKPSDRGPVVFIGHGQSVLWRDLKDHLQDKHGYSIEAYEVGSRAGHAIRDILEEMLAKSSFAIIVMTGEDKDADGVMHARDNVIHELGLFQGRLGFARAIVLLESGTKEFSNIHGIQQVRFSKDNIKETFGEVLAALKREFDKKTS